MKLSIITLALEERRDLRQGLVASIQHQIADKPVEHVILEDAGELIYGTKMRQAMASTQGDYICSVDDDDDISDDYVDRLLTEIAYQPDVVTFESQRVDTGDVWLLRANHQDGTVITSRTTIMSANHNCAWRRELALSAPWLPCAYGADVVWYRTLNASLPDMFERHIPAVLYKYNYSAAGTRCQRPIDTEPAIVRFAGGIDCWQHEDGRILISTLGRDHQQADSTTVVVQSADGSEIEVNRELLHNLCTVILQ